MLLLSQIVNNLLINLKSLVVLDPLALFFLVVILLVSLPSLLYSIGYLKNKFGHAKFLAAQLITLAFIASMLCLVVVGNAFASSSTQLKAKPTDSSGCAFRERRS